MAAPRPLVTLTLIPPMRLHTPMNHIMFFSPYLPKYRQHESLISKCYRLDSLWAEPENDDERACDEDADVGQEAWCEEQFLEIADLANGLLFWCCRRWLVRP
jgi:hypothetical protein